MSHHFWRISLFACLALGLSSGLWFSRRVVSSQAAPHAAPNLAGCPMFPTDNVWNTRIDGLPVHAQSADFINSIEPTRGLHPDFGAIEWEGAPIGIPFTIVTSAQISVNLTFDAEAAGESDPGPYPIPTNAPVEGNRTEWGDHHILVLEKDHCLLYEVYNYSNNAFPNPDGSWEAYSGAVFDLKSHALRPDTWTSADAAGLPILPGLARYDEVAAGEIAHALRFTANCSANYYIWPARHRAQRGTCDTPLPFGLRVRLSSSYTIPDEFSPQTKVLLQAMKTYGLIFADNGSNWYVTGSPNPGWDDEALVDELGQVHGSDLEVVDTSSLFYTADSGQIKPSAPPFTPTTWIWLPVIRK